MSQLSRLGVAGDLNELVFEGGEQVDDVGDSEIAKSPTAQDYTDINEVQYMHKSTCVAMVIYLISLQVADEETTSLVAEGTHESTDRFYKKGVEFAYSKTTGAGSQIEEDNYDIDDDEGESKPPVAAVPITQPASMVETQTKLLDEPSQGSLASSSEALELVTPKIIVETEQESQDSGLGSQTPPSDLPTSSLVADIAQTVPSAPEEDRHELPDNMSLDEVYAKVKKLFPGFKPNSILRFSSLLGTGKPSSLPKIWSEAKKPKKKKKASEPVAVTLDCHFIPPAHMLNTDDEVQSTILIVLCVCV